MTSSTQSPRPRRILAWLLLFLFAFVVILGLAAWNLLTPSRSVRVARDALTQGCARSAVVQFDAGFVSTWWIRQGVAFARGLPPEAREAVASLRGASVGVYKLAESAGLSRDCELAADLSAADAVLSGMGYVRCVDVRSARGERVAVWLSAPEEGGRLKACVAVRKEHDLVVVSAELDSDAVENVAELAIAKGRSKGRPGHGWF